MVLVDTSVWVDHFRTKSGSLVALLEKDEIATHPFVVGELACGNLSKRKEIITLLYALPSVHKAEDDEILLFLDRHTLMGRVSRVRSVLTGIPSRSRRRIVPPSKLCWS